jgi:hypothetical protein
MTEHQLDLFKRYFKLFPNLPAIEFGVFWGESIAQIALIDNRIVYGVDSFAGMSKPGDKDIIGGINGYPEGRLKSDYQQVAGKLKKFGNIVLRQGVVPGVLQQLPDIKYSVAHVDLDHYQPTLDTLNWLSTRCSVIIADDYFPNKQILASAGIDEFLKKTDGWLIIECVEHKAAIVRV